MDGWGGEAPWTSPERYCLGDSCARGNYFLFPFYIFGFLGAFFFLINYFHIIPIYFFILVNNKYHACFLTFSTTQSASIVYKHGCRAVQEESNTLRSVS